VDRNAKIRAQLNHKEGADYVISDGPPGIGCPVISSLSGADLALLLTEPTLSGQHDLERVRGVCRHFGVPALVCINKSDINDENTRLIESYCRSREIAIAARIPSDNAVTEAMINGLPVVEYSRNSVSHEIAALWETIVQSLKN
jgi:MinD superfamily P-loop ATPase